MTDLRQGVSESAHMVLDRLDAMRATWQALPPGEVLHMGAMPAIVGRHGWDDLPLGRLIETAALTLYLLEHVAGAA